MGWNSSHPTIIPWCENWARVHSDSLDWMGFFSSNLRVPRTHRNMAMLWCHPQTITVIRGVPGVSAKKGRSWSAGAANHPVEAVDLTPTLLKWSFFRKRRYKKGGCVFFYTRISIWKYQPTTNPGIIDGLYHYYQPANDWLVVNMNRPRIHWLNVGGGIAL